MWGKDVWGGPSRRGQPKGRGDVRTASRDTGWPAKSRDSVVGDANSDEVGGFKARYSRGSRSGLSVDLFYHARSGCKKKDEKKLHSRQPTIPQVAHQ